MLFGYNDVQGGSKVSLVGTKRGSGSLLRFGQGRVESPAPKKGNLGEGDLVCTYNLYSGASLGDRFLSTLTPTPG
jgi:hypothetical protein